MRRVVTALIILMAASALTACGSAPAQSTGTTGVPSAGVPAAPAAPAAVAVKASDDVLSPTQVVTPGEKFPTDPSSVPASILAALATKRPLLVYWYDPTTSISRTQRGSIDVTLKKYRGTIDLIALDYTVGLTSGTLDIETQKLELLAAALRVSTTPYILFVDAYGRITYRFAGWADTVLLNREVLRAIQ
jgi:hypothetical protein